MTTARTCSIVWRVDYLRGIESICRDYPTRDLGVVHTQQVSTPTFENLASNPDAVVWAMSLSGEITEISDTIQAVRGYTVEEACAQGGDEIHTPESLSVSLRYFEQFATEMLSGKVPDPFRGDLEYKCKDGSTIWCDVYVEPVVSDSGEVRSIRGVSTPATR